MSSPRLEQLLNFYNESPDDSFILFALAKEYEKLGQTQIALEHYLQLHKADPNYVGLYYHLGKLYEKLAQPQQAWNIYTEGLQKAAQVGDQHARSELAGARLSLGDEEDFV